MSLWDKTSKVPSNLTRAEKRNVIVTDVGFVRRDKYVDVHGNLRRKDVLLVPIGGLANSTNFGMPTVTDMYFGTNPNTTVTTGVVNQPVSVTVVYDEHVFHSGVAGSLKMTVANTVGGASTYTAVHTANATSVNGADNQLTFTFTPSVAGTYKIQAQTIANSTATAANLVSRSTGNEVASLVVSPTVSNTCGLIVVA